MIEISKDEKYIKYGKCTSCSSEENISAILITNDYTDKTNIILVCDECIEKYIKQNR